METQNSPSPNDANKVELPVTDSQELAAENPDDMYLLLQGSAFIKPASDSSGNLEIRFVDEADFFKKDFVPTRQALTLTGEVKILSVHLLVECSRTKVEALATSGQLGNYFPVLYNEVVETPINHNGMTSTGPPTK